MMSSGTSNKVNTSTQVEYSFVETRSIVGQEDIPVEYLSTSLANISLSKESKGVRPPLVGQASSSSNDSVSLSSEARRSTGYIQNRPTTSPTQAKTDQNKTNDSVDSKRNSNLLNRNDYISQKPPEGSYFHISTSLQPTESSHDLTRVRSSSSASSVTSSRPLEWDNGADVGYSQCYDISGKVLDPNMSTVERMALVSSTKLLRRSPEGTTGGTFQQVASSVQPKMRVKNKVGHPNAESTPIGTCVASDTSPDTVDFISPIPYEHKEESEPQINSSKLHRPLEDENTKNQSYLPHNKENIKHKVPLFPEMSLDSSMHSETEQPAKGKVLDKIGLNKQGSRCQHMVENCVQNESETYISSKMQLFNNELKMKLESVEGLDLVHKKLSSSLENVSNLSSNAPSERKVIPSTLPRSQSQSDLYLEELSCENIANSKCLKSNLAIQNLFKNKSASSSSVATVVHRKGDSPKHALVQTSVFNRQSVGTQVNESIERNTMKSKLFTGVAISETPHLPKAVLNQQHLKKSNYFDFHDVPTKKNCTANDQPLAVTCRPTIHDFSKEKELLNNHSGTHFHNGILCRGAHKKKLVAEEPLEFRNHYSTNLRNSNEGSVDTGLSIQNTSNAQLKSSACSINLNPRKNVSGGMVDSVESSIKSGGCGTDKQYSVTVEDRVNSFEYLPGHVYENNDRQQPVISCGTSSMSIENQTSNNATPEDQKIWESSGGSMSSTFEKDAQRGVDILSDFLKGAYENDTLLKRKLVRRVVDKLISKNHIDRKIEAYRDLMKNAPWVPPRPSNPVERNTVKTPKSKVPCEFSSHSEKSRTSNTSSECFIPRAADKNKYFPSFLRDDSCQKYQGELSSTSNATPEKSAKQVDRSSKSLKLTDGKTQKIKRNYGTKLSGESSSNNVLRTKNWKEPATKTEKLIEEKRKLQNESTGSHSSVSQLLEMERENQLFWIRSEIEHLSNLKLLLERQEELKRGLKNCKPRESRSSERNVLKDKNRVDKDKREAATPAHIDAVNKKSSLKTKSSYPTKLSEWLKDAVAVPKAQDIQDLEGWASHHYENDENIKSCMKRKSKHQTRQTKTRHPSGEQDDAIYDEPHTSSQRRRHDLKQPTRSTAADDKQVESASTDDKGYNRRNVNDRVGPPAQADGPSGRARGPEHGCQCLCQGKCQSCTTSAKTNKKKEPLGYYIIFDDPKKRDESKTDKGISWPMGERKRKLVSRLRAGADKNISEIEKAGLEKRENSGEKAEFLCCETEATSNKSDSDRNEVNPESIKPIFKGGAGELQYHLLQNRPSYVSRAEDRRQCIAQMQYLRELSSQNKQRLLSLTHTNPSPPPPTKVRRVFSQHKMRQMTEKKYRQLSEVREKLQDTKKKEGYRTNRLMAEIFKKNLQKRVLKGEVNLSNSVFVISSL